jgi:hypothetical protein
MLSKIEAKYRNLFLAKMDTLTQMCDDAALIAAHEVFGMGPGRAEKFHREYIHQISEMARFCVDDQKDDKEFVYAKTKIDEQLKAIVGEENFTPWEDRYNG